MIFKEIYKNGDTFVQCTGDNGLTYFEGKVLLDDEEIGYRFGYSSRYWKVKDFVKSSRREVLEACKQRSTLKLLSVYMYLMDAPQEQAIEMLYHLGDISLVEREYLSSVVIVG